MLARHSIRTDMLAATPNDSSDFVQLGAILKEA